MHPRGRAGVRCESPEPHGAPTQAPTPSRDLEVCVWGQLQSGDPDLSAGFDRFLQVGPEVSPRCPLSS